MKLLFIGCGDIGSRHIQAASNLSNVDEMYIVDPSNSSIAISISFKLDYQVFFFTIYIMPNIAKLMFCISKMEMSQISPAPYQSYVYQTLLI